jgi:hypothetical protein
MTKLKEFLTTERKFDLGSGTMGNGVVIWNRAKEIHGDYEKIAHIDRNRKIKYYMKNPPKEVKDYVEKIAKGKNFASSATQSHMKVFNEAKEYWIMDMGKSYKTNIEMIGPDGKPTKEIPRYGVWHVENNIAKEVVYTSNDLKKLQKKFNVPDDKVIKVK